MGVNIYRPNSPIISVASKENHLLTVDKLGRVVYRTLIPLSAPKLITRPSEFIVKSFFSENSLVIIAKQQTNRLKFFSIPFENPDERIEILENVSITVDQFDQIDYKKMWISSVDSCYYRV